MRFPTISCGESYASPVARFGASESLSAALDSLEYHRRPSHPRTTLPVGASQRLALCGDGRIVNNPSVPDRAEQEKAR